MILFDYDILKWNEFMYYQESLKKFDDNEMIYPFIIWY
jgi:hypothetical protein